MIKTIVYDKTSENLEYEIGLAMAYISFHNLELSGFYLDNQWKENENELKNADLLLMPTKLFEADKLDALARDHSIVIDTLDASYSSEPSELYIPDFDDYEAYFARKRKRMGSEERSRNIRFGLRSSIARKGAFSQLPYGYVKVVDKVKIDPNAASVVKDIYRWASDGMPCSEIATTLDELDIPTPTGIEHWHDDTIRHMLSNQAYTGVLSFDKNPVRKDRLPVDESFRVDFAAGFDPIVEKELFDQVQQILHGRQRKLAGDKSAEDFNVYGTLARCRVCGSKLGFVPKNEKNRRKSSIYRCVKHTGSNPKGEKLDKMPTIELEEMNQQVMGLCNEYISRAAAIVNGHELLMELYDWEQEDLEAKINQIGRDQLNGKAVNADGVLKALYEIEDERIAAEMKKNEVTNHFGTDPYEMFQDELDIEKVRRIVEKVFLSPDGKVQCEFKVDV